MTCVLLQVNDLLTPIHITKQTFSGGNRKTLFSPQSGSCFISNLYLMQLLVLLPHSKKAPA